MEDKVIQFKTGISRNTYHSVLSALTVLQRNFKQFAADEDLNSAMAELKLRYKDEYGREFTTDSLRRLDKLQPFKKEK